MTYEKVPSIITGKDLDYLSDMFNWTYGTLKININAVNEITDEEIKDLFNECINTFKETILNILSILSKGGTNE